MSDDTDISLFPLLLIRGILFQLIFTSLTSISQWRTIIAVIYRVSGPIMEIIETTAFTRRISNLLTDDEYAALQGLLTIQPDLGSLIPGRSGIRKLRWAARHRGKSGGVRIIYYWVVSQDLIYMLTAYIKNEQTNLSPLQLQF